MLTGGPAEARPPAGGQEDKQARETIMKYLAKLQGTERGQLIPVIDEPALAKLFPKHHFYVLRFRQYPVALVPPEPLKSNNVFAVGPEGKVEHLTDAKGLEKFFKAALPPVKDEAQAKAAATAWLRLAQEFHQDGFYQFAAPGNFTVAGTDDDPPAQLKVTGQAVVKPTGGNKGQVSATLVFEKGQLAKATDESKLFPGPRPICQALKLLDPDPVVRAMAEQTILVMGSAARDYLREQRAKADPELQRAIDRIWQRIVEEGR
jgi:hypothetical protein